MPRCRAWGGPESGSPLHTRRHGAGPTVTGITVTANGQPVELPVGATLGDLLYALDLAGRVAAAEHNGVAVARSDHAGTTLADGDRVELVRVMAGG